MDGQFSASICFGNVQDHLHMLCRHREGQEGAHRNHSYGELHKADGLVAQCSATRCGVAATLPCSAPLNGHSDLLATLSLPRGIEGHAEGDGFSQIFGDFWAQKRADWRLSP